MLQFYRDKAKVKLTLYKKFLLRKINLLKNQKLKDLYQVRQESLELKKNYPIYKVRKY